jgi:hypothetical protein
MTRVEVEPGEDPRVVTVVIEGHRVRLLGRECVDAGADPPPLGRALEGGGLGLGFLGLAPVANQLGDCRHAPTSWLELRSCSGVTAERRSAQRIDARATAGSGQRPGTRRPDRRSHFTSARPVPDQPWVPGRAAGSAPAPRLAPNALRQRDRDRPGEGVPLTCRPARSHRGGDPTAALEPHAA